MKKTTYFRGVFIGISLAIGIASIASISAKNPPFAIKIDPNSQTNHQGQNTQNQEGGNINLNNSIGSPGADSTSFGYERIPKNQPGTSTSQNNKQKHQDPILLNLQNFLNDEGINTLIEEDKVLYFKVRDNLYWITVEDVDGSNIQLYTMHANTEDATNSDLVENVAVNEVSSMNPYKVTYNNGIIEFTTTSYATTPEKYREAIIPMVKTLEKASSEYKKALATGKKFEKNLYEEWSEQQVKTSKQSKQVIPTPKNSFKPTMTISKIDFKGKSLNDPSDTKIIDYGYPINADAIRYIVPRIEYTTDNKTGVVLSVKIVNPQGQTMVYDENSDFIQTSYIPLKNGGKQMVEIEAIGSNNPNVWEPGQYKIFIYEKGQQIYEQDFLLQ